MSIFLDTMIMRAKEDKKTIVLPEGTDPRTIKAASIALQKEIADIIIIGDKEAIMKEYENDNELDLSKAVFIVPEKADEFEDYAETFFEMRKSKGITLEKAREIMKDPLYFGVMMVKAGKADGMVAGAVNSTPNVLRPSLQILKTAPGTKLVSAFFMMVVPNCDYGHNGTFLFADSGLNEDPDAEALSEIAISSAKSFKILAQAEPVVAMLSYSTYKSASSHLVDKVQLAAQLAKEKRPDIKLDGELQLDAAIVSKVGQSKAPGSEVAGNANVLIFPDLNAGNIGYKLTERLAKAEAYGPITQGIAKPVNDLSRGCTAEDIVGVIAITCVQAQNN